jgi:predicted dehydrogenase
MSHNYLWQRRDVLKTLTTGTALAAFTIVPRHVLGGIGYTVPSEKLNIAGIGVGNRGWTVIRQMEPHNIVAICDVDAKYLGKASERYPHARKFRDFRKLIDWESRNIDAVVVCSTDHTHAPASMAALRTGKHVYCEKPLTHSVYEARTLAEQARDSGLATQMGNEAHSGSNYRRVVELVRCGAIGDVREVHCWCDQAWGNMDRPPHSPPVPANLDWDLWLGPAPQRPYHPCYHPVAWRNWWDFGNGRLGDMGCHMLDLPFWALDLKYPLTIEAEGPPVHRESTPLWRVCRWEFPARGALPPVKLTWYDGGKRPALQKEHDMPDYREGTLFVGAEGMLIAEYGKHQLFPREKFADFRRPARTIEQSPGHAEEWLAACQTGTPTGTHFGYSGPLTETVLLGTVAYRTGQKLAWDAASLRVTNCSEANQYLRRDYRKGWTL